VHPCTRDIDLGVEFDALADVLYQSAVRAHASLTNKHARFRAGRQAQLR
jgi:hypothetical protein